MNNTNASGSENSDASLSPDADVGTLLTFRQGLLEQVWEAMRNCLRKDGMESEVDLIPHPQLAQYEMIVDTYDQTKTLVGRWRNQRGDLQGEIKVRGDGNVYAEVDVIRNHPTKARWFVEAVTAWGTSASLKTELRLLPSV